MHFSKILLVYMESEVHHLKRIQSELEKYGQVTTVERLQVTSGQIQKNDFIVTFGGDGTFIRISHFIKDETPILGVNADPTKKEGFFTGTTVKELAEHLEKGHYQNIRLLRLQAYINDKPISDLALNECYVGPRKPYMTFFSEFYDEEQKSSGILISTPAGSNAWLKSAGGKPLPLTARKFQYMVREPYQGKLQKVQNVSGVLKEGKTVSIKNKSQDAILVIDSLSKEFNLKPNDIVKVEVAKQDLHVLWFTELGI